MGGGRGRSGGGDKKAGNESYAKIVWSNEHNMVTVGIQGYIQETLTPGYILGNSRGKG